MRRDLAGGSRLLGFGLEVNSLFLLPVPWVLPVELRYEPPVGTHAPTVMEVLATMPSPSRMDCSPSNHDPN